VNARAASPPQTAPARMHAGPATAAAAARCRGCGSTAVAKVSPRKSISTAIATANGRPALPTTIEICDAGLPLTHARRKSAGSSATPPQGLCKIRQRCSRVGWKGGGGGCRVHPHVVKHEAQVAARPGAVQRPAESAVGACGGCCDKQLRRAAVSTRVRNTPR